MSFEYNGLHMMIDATVTDSAQLAFPDIGISMLE